MLGYGFFRMYLSQRIQSLYRLIEFYPLLEKVAAEDAHVWAWKEAETGKVRDLGADYWVSRIQMVVNGVLLGCGLGLGIEPLVRWLWKEAGRWGFGIAIGAGLVACVVAVFVQHCQRERILKGPQAMRKAAQQKLGETGG